MTDQPTSLYLSSVSYSPTKLSTSSSTTNSSLRLVICVGSDKKVVFKDSNKTLSSAVDKLCFSRNLDSNQFVAYDRDIPLSYDVKLSDINGGLVFLRRKEYSSIDLQANTSSLSDTSHYMKLLQDYLSDKEAELNHLIEQVNTLAGETRVIKSKRNKVKRGYSLKKDEENSNSAYLTGSTVDPSAKPGRAMVSLRSSSVKQRRFSQPLTDQQQIFRVQDENERLQKKLNRLSLEKKPPIMDCFSDSEITSLLQNEIVSRIMMCDCQGLAPDCGGVHPDITKLREFLKRGRYLEKSDYIFPSSLLKIFLKVYKSSKHSLRSLCFWLTQFIFILDWVNYAFPVGQKISYNGVDFSKSKRPTQNPTTTAESFWEELHQIILKILRKLIKYICNLLKPVTLKLLTDKNTKTNLSTIIKTLNNLFSTLTHNFVCNSVILQIFHVIYRQLDAILFNELLNFTVFEPQLSVHLKICLAEFDCWKYESLKKVYPSDDTDHPFLSFVDICVLVYMSQATSLLLFDKALLVDKKVLKDEFGKLSDCQLAVLLGRFVPDVYSPGKVPEMVLHGLADINNSLRTNVKVVENAFYTISLKGTE